MPSKKNKQLNFIDLFCGAGGLSLGFEKEGFNLLYANDIDCHSVDTFRYNRPNIPQDRIVCSDITGFISQFKNEFKKLSCDLIIGGPPCQGFSMANRQRLINDQRNVLYKKFVEIISLVKPRMFVMENVKGMLGVADQVVEDFDHIGYSTKYRVLNAKWFGVPQNRERLIYIGVRNSIPSNPSVYLDGIFAGIEKSKINHSVALREAFWGLRVLKPKTIKNSTELETADYGFTKDEITKNKYTDSDKYVLQINDGKKPRFIYNHKTRYNNERDAEIYRLLPAGGKSDHPSIAHIMPYKNRKDIFKDKFFKLLPSVPSKTITSHMKFDCHMYIHPFEARGLTPREAARIQSFPDDYVFLGPFTQWYHQAGNSVPPILARCIAKSIKKQLEKI